MTSAPPASLAIITQLAADDRHPRHLLASCRRGQHASHDIFPGHDRSPLCFAIPLTSTVTESPWQNSAYPPVAQLVADRLSCVWAAISTRDIAAYEWPLIPEKCVEAKTKAPSCLQAGGLRHHGRTGHGPTCARAGHHGASNAKMASEGRHLCDPGQGF
jgi:hypothetical protein